MMGVICMLMGGETVTKEKGCGELLGLCYLVVSYIADWSSLQIIHLVAQSNNFTCVFIHVNGINDSVGNTKQLFN